MKKIAKSLMMIAAVAVMAIGATGAYFTDQVEVTGNTLETGTIAIDVDGEVDSNHASYNFPDMKPGFVVDSDFVVNNTGSNPANITKKLVNVTDKGLANVIEYKLAVEVHDANGFVWGQTLYNYDVTVNDIRGTNMFLGMLPAGWHMNVTENYRMKTTAGNAYQGRTMGFDIQVLAEQLKGSVVLEDKNPTGWDVNQSSAVYGTLTYGVMDSMFNYSFNGVAPSANTSYSLVIGDDPYYGGEVLGVGTSDGSGNIALSGSVDLGTKLNQKVWLVLSSHWTGGTMSGWAPTKYLFETGLIDYYKS